MQTRRKAAPAAMPATVGTERVALDDDLRSDGL